MKLFCFMVFCCFCQSVFGDVNIAGVNKNGDAAGCTLTNATITKTTGSNSLSYKFTHSGTLFTKQSQVSNIREVCMFQLSSNTITSNLLGGWKFQSAIASTSFNLESNTCSSSSNLLNRLEIGPTLSTCAFKFNYTIVLVPDPNSSQGTATLQPLMNVILDDVLEFPERILVPSLNNTIGSAQPDPSPRSTCSLSVPSTLNLGNFSPSILTGINAKSSAKEFSVAFNCSQLNSFSFTPKVQMSFGLSSGTSCSAPNSVANSAIAASGVNLEISRKDTGAIICPTTSAAPTTLQFKTNTNTNIVYSDNITLRAALVNNNATGAVPKTGVFTSTVVFTITSF